MEKTGSEELLRKIEYLKKENQDLKMMLEAVTGHSDGMEADLLQKVHSGEQLFQVISKTIPVPLLIVIKDTGEILFANGHAQKMLGFDHENLVGKNASDFYENPQNRKEFLAILNERGMVENFEIKFKKIDNSVIWASLFSKPILFKEQDCLLTIVYDLTERKRAEEEKLMLERQLRHSQKMEAVGTLAGGISHDFNNILAIIFGKLELAGLMLPDDSPIKKHLSDALYVADRGKTLVRQILSFCRRTDSAHKPFIINYVISEAIEMIKNITPSNIEIKLSIQSKTSIIRGDPTQIHQILINLCTNAIYALKDRTGKLDIVLKERTLCKDDPASIPDLKPGVYAQLTVTDNGPGIEKEILDRIFDPFFTTKKPGEGTGMGLSIVHGIVRHHGGFVTVETQPKKGASFHCYFPVIAETAPVECMPVKTDAKGKERILFVDDEWNLVDSYSGMLESHGYHVAAQTDSREALALFQRKPHEFDLIITDNKMPHITGKSLAQEILKIRGDIPIILITGGDYSAEKEGAEKIGIKEILIKPFLKQELIAIIRDVLKSDPE